MRKQTIRVKMVSLLLIGSILMASCSSTTMIVSNPSGAKVYLDGEPVGVTPYTHQDTKIVGSTTSVRLEKEGYNTLQTAFSRDEEADVGAIVGGVFLLVPFLWTMRYKPTHTYELTPISKHSVEQQQTQKVTSKADRLRELKQLHDEGLITKEEYENEKAKILKEDNE